MTTLVIVVALAVALWTPTDVDTDPFNINQLGHPYQGGMYNFIGHTRFGAVEWRPAELTR